MHSWDPLSPWFSVSDKFSLTVGGVPTPGTIFPSLREDHVNNHVSLGVPPPNTDTRTPCHVEVTPRKSEGIEPFTLVNSPPGQVEDASSHMVNSPPCQVGVYPRESEGIEPFTLLNSLPGHVEVPSSHPINTPSGQVEDPSSHTVNSLPCQVRVYPRKSEGIEPFTLVNSPTRCVFTHGQLSAVSSRGLALAPDQLSVGISWGLVPSILYSPSLCIRSCNSCTITLTACPCTKPDRPLAILCNISLMFHFFWYGSCPTKPHTGYESRKAYGPTHCIRSPTIRLH